MMQAVLQPGRTECMQIGSSKLRALTSKALAAQLTTPTRAPALRFVEPLQRPWHVAWHGRLLLLLLPALLPPTILCQYALHTQKRGGGVAWGWFVCSWRCTQTHAADADVCAGMEPLKLAECQWSSDLAQKSVCV